MYYIKTNSFIKFQVNASNDDREKSEKKTNLSKGQHLV